jgi:hypothetical protein
MMDKFRNLIKKDEFRIFLLAFLLGIYLHWPSFIQADRFHDNWRQSPHWRNESFQQFHEDDLMLRYARFNTSPFSTWFYQGLSRIGPVTFWGKINAVVFFALTVLLIFVTGRGMGGRVCAWAAAIVFLFFPCMFSKEFVGGFMSALSAPLLCLAVLVIFTQKWWWTIPLMGIAAVIYPMTAVHTGVMLVMDVLANDVKNVFQLDRWKTKFVPILLASVTGLVLLLGKYAENNHEFGRLITKAEMGTRPEFRFKGKGRAKILPVPPLSQRFRTYWANPFHLALLLLVYLFVGKRMLKLPRGLYALLFASIFLYLLADILVMKLYFPSRYVKRSFPIFMALAGGYWLHLVYGREQKIKTLVKNPFVEIRATNFAIVAVALSVIGIYEFHDTYRPGEKTRRWDKHELYDFVRSIPGRPMIAVHPKLGSEIPLMAGKSVLVTKEFSHPWWTAYWEVIVERTHDFFRAYYATEPNELRAFIAKYNIDYWIVDRRDFHITGRNRKELYMQPFGRWIAKELKPSRAALIRKLPRQYRSYNGHRFFVASSEALLEWLDQRYGGNPSESNQSKSMSRQ